MLGARIGETIELFVSLVSNPLPRQTPATEPPISSTQSDPPAVVEHLPGELGEQVRLAMDRASAAGMNSLHWDGRSDTGTTVPRGAYLAQVTARYEDGQTASRITPLRLAR